MRTSLLLFLSQQLLRVAGPAHDAVDLATMLQGLLYCLHALCLLAKRFSILQCKQQCCMAVVQAKACIGVVTPIYFCLLWSFNPYACDNIVLSHAYDQKRKILISDLRSIVIASRRSRDHSELK